MILSWDMSFEYLGWEMNLGQSLTINHYHLFDEQRMY